MGLHFIKLNVWKNLRLFKDLINKSYAAEVKWWEKNWFLGLSFISQNIYKNWLLIKVLHWIKWMLQRSHDKKMARKFSRKSEVSKRILSSKRTNVCKLYFFLKRTQSEQDAWIRLQRQEDVYFAPSGPNDKTAFPWYIASSTYGYMAP